MYLDCTFGRGGHTKKILDKLSSKGQLVSFDLDDSAMEAAKNINYYKLENNLIIKLFLKQNYTYVFLNYMMKVIINLEKREKK